MHQPNFFPWLGYFYKMARADLFVYADTLAFSKGSYTQRVKIKTHNGPKWLTMSVVHTGRVGDPIIQVQCGGAADWRERLIKALRGHYAGCPHYKTYIGPIAEIICTGDDRLAEMNIRLIKHIAGELGIRTPTIRSSALHQDHLVGRATDWIIGVSREVGADTYLSGSGGANYQDEAAFEAAGLQLTYANYPHPVYPQAFGDFVAGLSIVDLLFNCGPDSRRVLGIGD